jgi:hypothetical protein
VTKNEVLVDYRGAGSYVEDYPWNKSGLDFRAKEATLSVLEYT